MYLTNFACLYFDQPSDLNTIGASLYRFSPQIYLVQPHAVMIEIGKSQRLFSESEFKSQIRASIPPEAQGFKLSLSPNPLFAFVMAKYASDFLRAPLSALIDIIDPYGRSEEVAKQTTKLISSLTKLQLKSLADFKELPRSQFPSRFGRIGLLLKARVDGEMIPNFESLVHLEKVAARTELPSSYNGSLAALINVIEGILRDKILPPLRKLGAKLEELKITFILEPNSLHPDETRVFVVKFVEPQIRAEEAMSIIWTCLEVSLQKIPLDPSTPILFIDLEAVRWAVELDEQVDGFDEARARKEKENILLSRQKERVGDDNIFRVELTQERRPEKSWKKVLDLKEQPKKLNVKGRVSTRPVYRLPHPHPVHITKDRTTISYRKSIHQIVEWEVMSEILASHWFMNESGELLDTYNRTYSRVIIKNGRELSVFQDTQGRFFLDGYSG